MLNIAITGFGDVTITDVIFDYNGTLAVTGNLIPGIEEEIQRLAKVVTVHVVTGDSYGTAQKLLTNLDCHIGIITDENQGLAKVAYLQALNSATTLMVGNGRNDQYVLKAARVGITVIGKEGAAVEAILASDVVCNDIFDVFALLSNTRSLRSTLRS